MAAQGTWQGHKIEISVYLSPKYLFMVAENLVKVDGNEVVRFGGFSLNYHVVGTFAHQGETTQIEVKTKAGLFLPNYFVKIDEQVVMQGYLGMESISLIQIYFGLIGLAYVSSLMYLVIPQFRSIIFQIYAPQWFVATKIIDIIFGAFFLYFAISLKSLLI